MLDLKALAEDYDAEGTLPSSIIVLNQTNQLKAMTTIIRDKDSESEDFIFYLERTSSLVLERYLSLKTLLMKGHWMNYHTSEKISRLPVVILTRVSNYQLKSVLWKLSAQEEQ